MSEIKYITSKSVNETLVLLSEYKAQACLIAGGTDLIAKKKRGVELPPVWIDIRAVQDLNYIEYSANSGLKIGALTSLTSVESSPVIKSRFPALADTASMMASPNVRLQATIGGNLCNAAPSADTIPTLIVLGAQVKISSIDGERIVPVEDLFTGPGKTVLNPGEILSEIQVPPMPSKSAAVYLKQKRREGADLAVVGVAALVAVDAGIRGESNINAVKQEEYSIHEVRIALGAVASTPLRAKDAEYIIKGKRLTDENLKEAAKMASCICAPINDARGSAEYRLKMIEVLVPRALKQALEQIKLEV